MIGVDTLAHVKVVLFFFASYKKKFVYLYLILYCVYFYPFINSDSSVLCITVKVSDK